MKPLHNRVLLKHLEEDRDRLWLPESAGVVQRGLVVVAGDGCRYLEEDMRVLFRTEEAVRMRVPLAVAAGWDGPPLDEGEEDLYLVDEPAVLLILD